MTEKEARTEAVRRWGDGADARAGDQFAVCRIMGTFHFSGRDIPIKSWFYSDSFEAAFLIAETYPA